MPECFKCKDDASIGRVAIRDGKKWLWVWDSLYQWEDFSASWIALGQDIWSRPDSKVDASSVYCLKCWKDWGQHVQEGCARALSKSCEALAIQARIQLSDPTSANPFYCPHCVCYFNHGQSSLEKHLLSSPSHQAHRLARKRKMLLPNKEFTAPILDVSGCSTQTISDLIKGRYTAKHWHHGKPLYVKDGPQRAVIHFWDDRDGPRYHGWWLCPRVGDVVAWAYSSSNLSPGELTVPSSGWMVQMGNPNGCQSMSQDMALSIAVGQATDACNDSQVELRWEFLAGGDGEKEDWKPMGKDMNDALEKRWAEGWDEADASDIFYVQANGFCYGVDCTCMLQWNTKTQRRREIRRGGIRPDISKLTEKATQVEQLLTEKQELLDKNASLMAEVARLETLGLEHWDSGSGRRLSRLHGLSAIYGKCSA